MLKEKKDVILFFLAYLVKQGELNTQIVEYTVHFLLSSEKVFLVY